jgi:tetratricopeptide (TPR) repeat protein
VLFALVLVAIALPGCTSLRPHEVQWFEAGQEAYDKQQYRLAIQKLTPMIDQAAPCPEVATALLLRGYSHVKLGRADAAIADLRLAALQNYDPESTWLAYFALGTIHYEDGRWAAAGDAYLSASDRMPKRPPHDTALYRAGVAYARAGQWSRSRQHLHELVTRYRGSQLAVQAERTLAADMDHFAVQCGAFGLRENADLLANQLRTRGFGVYVRQETRDGKPLFVVLAGPFTDYSAAEAAVGRIRTTVPDATIVP